MFLHMVGQCCLLGVGHPADLTLVGLLPGVGPGVVSQLVSVLKPFPTLRALVGLGVALLVDVPQDGRVETLAANTAGKVRQSDVVSPDVG